MFCRILVATFAVLMSLAQALGQAGDLEIGTYSCTTSHMAGIHYDADGAAPTAGAVKPRPQLETFSVTVGRLGDLSPADVKLKELIWGNEVEKLNIGANTFAAKFSAGFAFPSVPGRSADSGLDGSYIMLGHLIPSGEQSDNPRRAPNRYSGYRTDAFSIASDRSFTAYSNTTYAIGRGGVFVLYGKCVQKP